MGGGGPCVGGVMRLRRTVLEPKLNVTNEQKPNQTNQTKPNQVKQNTTKRNKN